METSYLKQELAALIPARVSDGGAPGDENLTEMVSNLPRRLQSRSPSASATRPTCVGRVLLHTDSNYSPFNKNND